ncbi:MetQ/NlpA family ABC transporter substrate-binding protein [Actinotalea sp. Marseille-Q4924]|uniref:MetQ/NlpA family ABC transporter substrate-binding protein n=1 Tax=Actinotalea sp. Marseille-Q4924 TaxID=2866571 RepID=UPI001CE49209|nr:MetQ/NlpA family ABC transporter substrate-binding protein [Actinotalea sp. Marseille-Q4924]
MHRTIPAVALPITLATALSACSGAQADTGDDGPVTVGVTDASKDYWRTFEQLAAEEGIEVELVNFTDYAQPNPILSQGELDLNQFQHLLYLANYNVNADDDLVPVGSTAIYQLGLYTTKGYASPEDLPDGAEIAIPNDPVNQARALLVLQSAGLVELADGGNAFSTPAEVVDGSRVTVVPVDASQTAVQVNTIDAAVINNNFAADAGIDPTTAIYSDLEDTRTARPYLNLWVARADDADNPVYAQLVEIYQSEEVLAGVEAENKGTAVTEQVPAEELRADLTELEQLVRDSQG